MCLINFKGKQQLSSTYQMKGKKNNSPISSRSTKLYVVGMMIVEEE